MAKKWIQGAIMHPGAFTAMAKAHHTKKGLQKIAKLKSKMHA